MTDIREALGERGWPEIEYEYEDGYPVDEEFAAFTREAQP